MKRLFFVMCALASLIPTGRSAPAGGTVGPRVALVFDDGPDATTGPRLQQLLQREGLPVTFAHVGRNVEKHGEVTRAARAAGHEVVNHSYTHAGIQDLDAEGVRAEVVQGKAAIQEALGAAPAWYWPPFLAVDDRLRENLRQADQPLYVPHHLVDSRDWNRETNADEIRRRATTDVRDGSVILFHEWRTETLEQLPAILRDLREQGARFMTFSELARDLKARPPARGPDQELQQRFTGGAEK